MTPALYMRSVLLLLFGLFLVGVFLEIVWYWRKR